MVRPRGANCGTDFLPRWQGRAHRLRAAAARLCRKEGLYALVRMPCNLAVFNVNGVGSVRAQFPDVERQYITGHSLSGAMAANYAAAHPEDYDGSSY